MGYCTKEEVKQMFKNWATVVTPAISDISIDDLISETTAEINGALYDFYNLPITGDDALATLKKVCKLKVAGTVDDILNTYSNGDIKPSFSKDGQNMLDQIAPPAPKNGSERPSPTMRLIGASFKGKSVSGNQPFLAPTEGRIFEKGGNNW